VTATTDSPGVIADELVLTGGGTPVRRLVAEVWASRELVVTLARKSFFVQYRRTALGILWAVGLPVFQALILALVFSRVARFAVPRYPAYVLSGMVPWTYFNTSLQTSATSIVDNSSLSSKIYFPRSVLPLSTSLANAYALLVGTGVLVVFAAGYGATPGWRTLLLPVGALIVIALAASLGLVLSVTHVYLRDTRYVVQAAALGWLWLTPVVYPIEKLHGAFRTAIEVNPMTGVVELYHAAVYEETIQTGPLLVTLGWIVAILTLGVVLHSRYDRVVADLL
jgi:ABC-type polysaccharide/polyol phosphate export permease